MTCNVCGYQWPAGAKFRDDERPQCPRCSEYAGDLTDFLEEMAEQWGTDLDHADEAMIEAWTAQFWAERNG